MDWVPAFLRYYAGVELPPVPPVEESPVAAWAVLCGGDVLVHTWDLAPATGLDESLDAEEVHRMVDGMEPHDEALRASGHYGPRVEVPDDADEQTRLLAFMGRRAGSP